MHSISFHTCCIGLSFISLASWKLRSQNDLVVTNKTQQFLENIDQAVLLSGMASFAELRFSNQLSFRVFIPLTIPLITNLLAYIGDRTNHLAHATNALNKNTAKMLDLIIRVSSAGLLGLLAPQALQMGIFTFSVTCLAVGHNIMHSLFYAPPTPVAPRAGPTA